MLSVIILLNLSKSIQASSSRYVLLWGGVMHVSVTTFSAFLFHVFSVIGEKSKKRRKFHSAYHVFTRLLQLTCGILQSFPVAQSQPFIQGVPLLYFFVNDCEWGVHRRKTNLIWFVLNVLDVVWNICKIHFRSVFESQEEECEDFSYSMRLK